LKTVILVKKHQVYFIKSRTR